MWWYSEYMYWLFKPFTRVPWCVNSTISTWKILFSNEPLNPESTSWFQMKPLIPDSTTSTNFRGFNIIVLVSNRLCHKFQLYFQLVYVHLQLQNVYCTFLLQIYDRKKLAHFEVIYGNFYIYSNPMKSWTMQYILYINMVFINFVNSHKC